MKFEWDDDKNQQNIIKHGLRFEDACRIFEGFTMDAVDSRADYGERRIISIGELSDVAIIVVVHTDRDGICRIISARPAKRTERKAYDEAIQKTFNA